MNFHPLSSRWQSLRHRLHPSEMARYKIILAYDGTRFQGFQRQPKVQEALTVQDALEEALRQLAWRDSAVLAAGRTDAGVHAQGQVIAFDLDWKHTEQALQAALNAHLPADIVVQAVRQVQAGFHPRYDALARRYRYRIYCRAVADPLRERYAWRVWPAVDLEVLSWAASCLPGRHDFAAFGSPLRTGGSTVRDVFDATWHSDGSEIVFQITANAFLYRMVRRLVFTQVAAGQGRLEPDQTLEYLASPPENPVQGLAPPQGLTLVEVIYTPGSE